jgi:hypothetical protein
VGVLDRDYMRDRDPVAFRPHRPQVPWAWVLGLFVLGLYLALAPLPWLPSSWAQPIAHARSLAALAPAGWSPRSQQVRSDRPRTEVPQVSAAPLAQRHTIPCWINGVKVEVVGTTCPPGQPARGSARPLAPQAGAPPAAETGAQATPGTIYRCKSYSGSLFWSEAHCSQHRSLVDRIASVPPGLPFQQRVDLAARAANEVESSVRAEQREGGRAAFCASLRGEREQIWKRSGSGAGYVSITQLGADQVRWREIDAEMSRYQCRR